MTLARRGRPYVEAFPAVQLRAAQESIKAGLTALEWMDERDAVIGHAEVDTLARGSLAFRYRFHGTPNAEQGEGRVRIGIVSRRLAFDRIVDEFQCPGCDANIATIYYVSGKWACKSCHGLCYRIQRLSPSHKVRLRDATKHGYEQGSGEHGDGQRLKTVMDDVAHLQMLPEQLRFNTSIRWLASDDLSSTFGSMASTHQRWQEGEPGGFAVFGPVPLPAPDIIVPAQMLMRSGMSFIGGRLFDRRLEDVLASRFERLAHEVWQSLCDSGTLGESAVSAIMATVAIEPLSLGQEREPVTCRRGKEGRVRVAQMLTFTGDVALWRAAESAAPAPRKLKAELDEGRLVIATWVDSADEQRARSMIASAASVVEAQLAAHRAVLRRYTAHLKENARNYLRGRTSLLGQGRPDAPVRVLAPK